MPHVDYEKVFRIGVTILYVSTSVGLPITLSGAFNYIDYCESINIICNVTKINYVSTWTPMNKNITGFVYKGELDLALPDNAWNHTKCYYDNRKNECPSEECPDISGANLILVIIGSCVMVGPAIIYIIVFVLWFCFECCDVENRSDDSSD